MPDWSPPSIPRKWLVGMSLVYVLILLYSVIIAGQILLGVLPGIWIGALYLFWRVLAALEAIADALQRIASQQEQDQEAYRRTS